MNDLTQRAIDLEAFETPKWCIDAILEKELMTPIVWDPCTGRGVMAAAAMNYTEFVMATDVHDWEYLRLDGRWINGTHDFLTDSPDDIWQQDDGEMTVFMNPPFSKAEAFVEKAHEIGARKIICFQRFSWWEAAKRKEFWAKYPPNRIYICGNRASCWRFDIPEEERGSGTTTAHAWFVWEEGHPQGTLIGHVWKGSPC